MPTVYDQLRSNNSEYIPQFVGSTYNELNNAAATLDKRYRDNRAYADKVAMVMAQEQYLEADKGIKDALAQSIYGSLDKISKSEDNFENSTAAVSQLARDFFTNQDRLAARENYNRVQAAKEMQTKLGANALNFGADPYTFSTIDPETGERRMFDSKIEQRADYAARMQQLLGKVADDGYTTGPTGEKLVFDNTERSLIKSGKVNLISKDKLNRLAEGLLYSYKSSPEGQQDIRRLTQLAGFKNQPITVTGNGVTRQTTDVDEDIRQRFRAIAAPQAYTDSNLKWDDFNPNGAGAPAGDTPFYTPTSPGGVTDNTSINVVPDVSELENEYIYTPLDDNGNPTEAPYMYVRKGTREPVKIVDFPKATVDGGGEPVVNPNYDKEVAGLEKVTLDPNTIEGTLQNTFRTLTTEFPGIKNYYGDYDKFKKAYNAAAKSHTKITPVGNQIAPEQAKVYEDVINRTAAVSPIYFREAGKKARSLEEMAKDLGTSPQNIEFKPISTYYDSPSKDLPGGYVEAKVVVKDPDADQDKIPATVFIPLNDQFSAAAKPIDDVFKASLYQGRDTYTPQQPYRTGIKAADGTELYVYTVTYPKKIEDQKDGKINFDTFVIEGDGVPNATGGVSVQWNSDPVKIGDWRNTMIKRQGAALQNALNSGQTFSGKDVKDRGVQF